MMAWLLQTGKKLTLTALTLRSYQRLLTKAEEANQTKYVYQMTETARIVSFELNASTLKTAEKDLKEPR
jgi:hypothetical protein